MKAKNVMQAAAMAAALAGAAGQDMVAGLDLGMNNQAGTMYFANESRFVEANFSEPLTTYAIGWKDPNNIEDMLEFVAPKVQVSRRFEFAQANNAEEFMSESDDVRAIGSDFKRIEFTSSKVNSKTLNKGLTIRVDLDNVEGNPNWREQYTGRIMRRLLRNELRRGVALLIAAGSNTAKTWDTTAGKDPDQDVTTQVIAFADTAGVSPNRALYGQIAFNKRKIAHRAQNTAGGFASAGLGINEVAGLIGVDEARISKERYASSASARTKIFGDYVIIYLAEAGQTTEDASNIKRFVSPTMGGTPFRVYEQQINAKMIDITVEHYSNIVVTSTLGIQKLTIS